MARADPIGRRIVIRTALGADRRQVVGWFLMRGLRLSVAGMALGLTLSLIVVKLIATLQGEAPPSGIIGLAAARLRRGNGGARRDLDTGPACRDDRSDPGAPRRVIPIDE